MSEILTLFKLNSELTTFYIISGLLFLSANICITVAVAIDCKINHVKHRVLWPLIVFFTYYGAILFFIFRNKMKQEVPMVCTRCGKKAHKKEKECKHCGGIYFAPKTYENRGRLNSIIIALIVSSVVLFAGNYMFTHYSPMAEQVRETEENFDANEMLNEIYDYHDDFRYGYEVDGNFVYYDAKGNTYNDAYEVVLYSEDGKTYTYDTLLGYVNTENEDDVISVELALIDSDGYIVNASQNFETIPETTPFKTVDGKMYYKAEEVSWNAEGKMVYTNNGREIVN